MHYTKRKLILTLNFKSSNLSSMMKMDSFWWSLWRVLESTSTPKEEKKVGKLWRSGVRARSGEEEERWSRVHKWRKREELLLLYNYYTGTMLLLLRCGGIIEWKKPWIRLLRYLRLLGLAALDEVSCFNAVSVHASLAFRSQVFRQINSFLVRRKRNSKPRAKKVSICLRKGFGRCSCR